MPKPPRVKALEPSFRRKYITWAHVTKFGGSPGCRACSVDGPAHSKACRERFEKIFADEAEQHATKVAMESASRKAALSSEAALAPSAPMAEPMLVENERMKPQEHEDVSMAAPRLGTGPVAGTAADAPMPTSSSSTSSERDPKRLRTIAGLTIFATEMYGRDYKLEHPMVEGVQDGEHEAIEMHVGFDDEKLIEKPAGPVQVPLPTKTIYGARSGEPLDPVKVAAGRQREMDSIYRHDVKEDVLNSEAVGGVHVKGDWVKDNKGDVVRSRFVVKQIAYDYRDDVSQSTPALLVFRMMLAFASSKCPLLKTGSNFFIAIWDISVAFMHATIDELIFVHPPKDLVKPGFCWKLKSAMNGTRRASRQWRTR